jgi:hypothetical protein
LKTFLKKTLIAFILLANIILAQVNKGEANIATHKISEQFKSEELNKLKEAEEIFINISYAGLVKTTVISYYYKNEFYFPFKEMCDNLEIINKIENYKLTGFLNHQSNSYSILFHPSRVVLSDTSKNFGFTNYLKTDFDYYFNAEFYKNIFGLEIRTDFSNLVASLQSKELMPIFQRVQREKSHDVFANKSEKESAPLLFPRERKLLGGAIFD